MHAGFPCFSREICGLMRLGASSGKLEGLLDRAGGTLVARGMAVLLEAALCLAMRYSLFSRNQASKAEAFFRENFEIRDPDAPQGLRYYQGKILIRTTKPEDDMNVYLEFCADPKKLFRKGPLGRLQKMALGTALDVSAVVSTRVLTEKDAADLQKDPEKVDLVLSFRDVKSILGLIGRPALDAGALLVENVVRFKGNVGHLFKLGAIAKNVELVRAVN